MLAASHAPSAAAEHAHEETLVQHSGGEEETSLGTSIRVNLVQQQEQSQEKEKFLRQEEVGDTIVLVVNDQNADKDADAEKSLRTARRQIATAFKKGPGTSLKSSLETTCVSRATRRRG